MNHIKLFESFNKIFETNLYKGYRFEDKWYHISTPGNRESILKNGLNTNLGNKVWTNNEYPKGIYIFADKEDGVLYGTMIFEGDWDMWEVDTTTLNLLEDPEDPEDSYFRDSTSVYVTETIPTDKIKLLPFSDEEKEEFWRQYDSGELLHGR